MFLMMLQAYRTSKKENMARVFPANFARTFVEHFLAEKPTELLLKIINLNVSLMSYNFTLMIFTSDSITTFILISKDYCSQNQLQMF